MSEPVSDDLIAAVRAFNRFYTRRLGVLEQQLLDSPFSLAEARVLYELAHRDHPAAKEIGTELGLDAGYLSRIIQNLQDKGLITRKASAADRRQYHLSLTTKGRLAFDQLNRRSHDHIAAMVGRLSPGNGERLVQAMATVERLLKPSAGPPHCATRVLATWAGWCRATARCMRPNMASMLRSKGW